jgi:hypothetical protein
LRTPFLSGVNLPVLADQYNHDLAPNERFPQWGQGLDPVVGFRHLAMCRWLGFQAVRIWLCEDCEGIITDSRGRPTGVRNELLDSVSRLQDGARVSGLRLYWTLLDANSWSHSRDKLTRHIAGDVDASRHFAEVVARPLAERLDSDVTFALEVFNEPESLSLEVEPEVGLPWPDLVRSIREIRSLLHDVVPGVPITAGTQPVFLPGLLADGWQDSPVDAIDLHVYHPDGGLPSREDLPVHIGDLPLWAGECGTAESGDPDRLDYLLHYLWGARDLGYQAAFLWKLDGELTRWREFPERQTEGFELLPLGEKARNLLTVEWA